MDLYKPNVSEELAKSLVKDVYGLDVVSIKRMVSYDDQNFHISVSENHKNPHISNIPEDGFTLKITNTQKSSVSGHFDSMHATMFHLNRKGLRAPLPVRNLKGETWTLERVPLLNEGKDMTDPMYCGVHMLSYIAGSVVPTVECTTDVLFQWGALLAKYHNAVQDFSCPILKDKYVFWSLERIPEIKNYMDGLPEDKKELIDSVLKKYPIEIAANYHRLKRGIIHGDFNENNVLVQKDISRSGDKTITVDGILDFEDIHEGVYMWDVAVMMAYALLAYDKEDVLEGPGHALAGYLSIRPLDSLELNLLKIGMECRLSQSLVLCAHSFQKDPNNLYLMTSAKTGWTKLRTMCTTTNEDLQQKWNNVRISYEIK